MSKIGVTIGKRVYEVEISLHTALGTELTVVVDGEPVQVIAPEAGGLEPMEWIVVDTRPQEFIVDHDLHWVKDRRGLHRLEVRDLEAPTARQATGERRVKAPVPGLISRVLVQDGDAVEAGQPLVVLEAMKMENEIRAPRAGVIGNLNARPGQTVTLHEVLAEVT